MRGPTQSNNASKRDDGYSSTRQNENDDIVQIPDDDDSLTRYYVSECFCPLLATSRFPYKYLRGGLSQRVASNFFDVGKFWDREWDIYYIYPPSLVSTRALLLVPAVQVRDLIRDINRELRCRLTMPANIPGFVIPFRYDGTPQPTFLGRSRSKEDKEKLEEKIPARSAEVDDPILRDPVSAYYLKLEAGVLASKNKSQKKAAASKAKRAALRAQNKVQASRCLRRAQCYFALRPRCPRPSVLIADANDMPSLVSSITLPPLDPTAPAPFIFWNEPIFISVDVESNERCHSQLTEVGISTLDTLDLVGLAPGENAQNWTSRIRSRHFRVKEYASHVNSDFVSGCPDMFDFGDSEWAWSSQLAQMVDSCFQPPYSGDVAPHPSKREPDDSMDVLDSVLPSGPAESKANLQVDSYKQQPRSLIFVGHNVAQDIAYLQSLGTSIFKPKTDVFTSPKFLEVIDTAEMYRMLKGDVDQRSLGRVLVDLGITPVHLHNAGNDARYTLEALVLLAIESRRASDIEGSAPASSGDVVSDQGHQMIPQDSGLPTDLSALPTDLSGLPADLSGLPADLSGLPTDLSGLPPDISGVPSMPNEPRLNPDDIDGGEPTGMPLQ